MGDLMVSVSLQPELGVQENWLSACKGTGRWRFIADRHLFEDVGHMVPCGASDVKVLLQWDALISGPLLSPWQQKMEL